MSKILIVDTETTGLKEPIEPIELAYLEIDYPSLTVTSEYQEYFLPSKAIEFGAMATSHILYEELLITEGIKTSSECKLPEDVTYIIGHNVDYDWKVLSSPNVKRICTAALSRAKYPIDNYSQSAMLYYFLGNHAKPLLKEAHNALADVHNCLRVLKCIIEDMHFYDEGFLNNIEWLYEQSELARIPKTLHFGKFYGQPYTVLDQGYVNWWCDKSDSPPNEYQKIAIRNAGFRVS